MSLLVPGASGGVYTGAVVPLQPIQKKEKKKVSFHFSFYVIFNWNLTISLLVFKVLHLILTYSVYILELHAITN